MAGSMGASQTCEESSLSVLGDIGWGEVWMRHGSVYRRVWGGIGGLLSGVDTLGI